MIGTDGVHPQDYLLAVSILRGSDKKTRLNTSGLVQLLSYSVRVLVTYNDRNRERKKDKKRERNRHGALKKI